MNTFAIYLHTKPFLNVYLSYDDGTVVSFWNKTTPRAEIFIIWNVLRQFQKQENGGNCGNVETVEEIHS